MLGAPELFVILLIVIVLFGASRIAGVGGALGKSVRDFRTTVREDETSDTAGRAGHDDLHRAHRS